MKASVIKQSPGDVKTILIIDDEPSIAEIINFYAMEMGYSSDAAHTGNTAIEKIEKNGYWAVLCDYHMPGLNGMEIYDKVKALNSHLSRKFVLLTGTMFDQDIEETVAEERIKVLHKPFHFEGIKRILSELEP
jgi:CheY-like chemotaxis protein